MNFPYKKTKILATIGPASRSPRVIEKLLKRGANCFRINFSHGTHEEHGAVIKTIRSIARKLGLYPAILADLQGPKIRTGMTPDNATVSLSKGSTVNYEQFNECLQQMRKASSGKLYLFKTCLPESTLFRDNQTSF